MSASGRDLPQRAVAALIWLASFTFASGIFLAATQLLRPIPPTPHIAVGRVTIENASKTREYAAAALFFLLVPAGTVLLQRYGAAENERLRRKAIGGQKDLVSLLFVAPFLIAPFLYLTTGKWGWPIVIPLAAGEALPWALIGLERTRWLRALLVRDLAPYHAMILTNGFAWILFRYIATARRIAHIPTLFLEILFILFFVLLLWAVFVFLARLATLLTGIDTAVAVKRFAVAGLPLLVLPLLAIVLVPSPVAISVVIAAVLVAVAFALRGGEVEPASRVRAIVAYAAVPLLLYCFNYASTAHVTQWLDLFHRGESLGPASDYLRGKVPYRDVFVLHGLMHDGQLDAWLFQLFGRDLNVALARPAILGAFAAPALWYLGMAIFDSIPLAVATMFLGTVTTEQNERTLFEVAVLACVVAGVRVEDRRPRLSIVALVFAGVFAALGLFFSYDIGLYSIGGAVIFLAVTKRLHGVASFLAGVIAGALPFVVYLGSRGALGAFAETSFVAVPRYIDPIWSTPFPDLAATFRSNLGLRTFADFFIGTSFRFILAPLVIAIALAVLIYRFIRKRVEWIDVALLALTVFAILTERSALGRADAPHQYFSSFLIGPMILVLLILFVRQARPVWYERDANGPAFLILFAIAIAPLVITALWVPDVLNFRLDDLVRYQPRVVGAVRDATAEEVNNRIDAVRYHVYDLSPKGSPIFDFSNQPALYFFVDRPNPTRFYQIPIVSPVEFQAETIAALERARPQVVIRRSPQGFDVFDGVDNSVRAQAVAAYLDDHYAYARSARGVEIWTRKTDGPRVAANSYLRLIRVPTAKELAASGSRSRLVFPSVGSTAGVAGALWRSDLTLRNPYKDSVALALRYVAGDTRIDRRLTLAAGQTMRFPDVVKSLFAGPDSLGVLWVDYRGDRGPVARVETYDANRRSSGSLQDPLTTRDAATSGTDADRLTIIGLPGGGPTTRRINAGVVNVGDIPATVRISVRTSSGRIAGHPLEVGLAEDESLHVTDVENALGVAVDETEIIDMTLVAGVCVGYATVVSTDGSNQFIAAVPSPKS
ncbi:MAG TPA: hypothetical protein VLU46_08560 [Thermoanaerobaculia bacterium]|nr:hypothetical protein [Thermoanaerobaculia bacterium]